MSNEPLPSESILKQLAKDLFVQSLKCYMGKSLHAFEEIARIRFGVSLQINIFSCDADFLARLSAKRKKETQAYILTKEQKRTAVSRRLGIEAKIYILAEATDAFVKFIILHELWHLYKDLEYNAKSQQPDKPQRWTARPTGDIDLFEQEEAECNRFALLLSFYHEQLYTCEGLRAKYKQFYVKPKDSDAPAFDVPEAIKHNRDAYIRPGSNFLTPTSFNELEKEGLQGELKRNDKDSTSQNETAESGNNASDYPTCRILRMLYIFCNTISNRFSHFARKTNSMFKRR